MRPHLGVWRFVLVAALCVLLAGCASNMAYREGNALIAQGKLEEGLAVLKRATQAEPDNLESRIAYLSARDDVTGRLLANAQHEASAGHIEAARSIYKRTLKLDPDNGRALDGLAALGRLKRYAKLVTEARALIRKKHYDGAERKLALVLREDPRQEEARALRGRIEELVGNNQVMTPALRQSFKKPIDLEFRDANLKQIMEALSRYSGLNFILDKDVPRNLATTLFLHHVSVADALNVVLTTLQLKKQILNDTTVLIYPNTAAKRNDHQDLVVKTFYLSNADAKQVMQMLKTVLKAKDLYVDEKLNLLIMRDSPSAIRLAERLVALQDVEQPEVMLEVKVMEVQRSRLEQLGIQFPDQLTLTPLASGNTLTLKDLQTLNASRLGAKITDAIINLHKDIGVTNILANPRIRTHNREKAEIMIGDRVPVITTTSTATGFVTENVQYVNVGLKLDVQPTIYPDEEVAIKLALEVSSIVNEVVSKAGTVSYQIGTRNASTVLRLKDGETQILGGLINHEDQSTDNRVPGLADFPLLGRLFSSQKNGAQKTELILSITPHIIRGIAPPPNVPTEFWSGTEQSPGLRPAAMHVSMPAKAAGKAAKPTPPTLRGGPAHSRARAPALSWEGDTRTKVGGIVRLKLKVSSDRPIAAFPLQIKYDPAVLALTKATPGGFLAQGGTPLESTRRIAPKAGMAFVTETRKGRKGAEGEGILLEIGFKALKPAANTLVSVLPTAPLAPGGRPIARTGPAVIGVSIASP